jgi:tetratricopeptide (TPR) repeat protein
MLVAIALLSMAPVLQGGPPQAAASPDLLRAAAAAYESGDGATAIRLYREFLKEYSEAAEIRSNLAAALVKAGRLAEAIDEYKRALTHLPNNPRVRMNLALAYYKLGRIPDATRELEALHTLHPFELQPAVLLADCLLQAGRPKDSAELIAPFEQENPGDRGVAYILGMALLKQNDTERAQRVLDRILRDGESAESAYLLGYSAYLGQDKVAAARYLERAIQLNPNLPGVHSFYASVLREIGKPEAAPEQYREELSRNPHDFVANLEIGMLLKQDRKFDESLVHIERALQVRPSDPGARYQRASIRLLQGDAGAAAKDLEKLVGDFPNFAEAHAALATAYYRLKRKEDGDRARAAAGRAQREAQKQLEENRRRAAEGAGKPGVSARPVP